MRRFVLSLAVVCLCCAAAPAEASSRDDLRALQRVLNTHRAARGLSALAVNGVADPPTLTALRQAATEWAAPRGSTRGAAGALDGSPASADAVLKAGSRGPAVRALQRMINAHRRARGLPPIAVDGIFGPETEEALARVLASPPRRSAPSASGSVAASSRPPGSGPSTLSAGPGSAPDPRGATPPLSLDGGWLALYDGLTQAGAEIPRRGLRSNTLRRTLGIAVEPQGAVVRHVSTPFVRGLVSWFGGTTDRGVTATETGALTGERLRSLNVPARPTAAQARARPEAYYYVAMRFDYGARGKAWWRNARLLVINPRNDQAIVVRPVDWGPNTNTGRILDLSPQALRDLGLSTDDTALVSFAKPGSPLGVVR